MSDYDFSEKSKLIKEVEVNNDFYQSTLNVEKLYLLIDLTLKNDGGDYFSKEQLIKLEHCYIPFPHHDLKNTSELLLVCLTKKNTEHTALIELSVRCSLAEINPERLKKGHGRSICAWINSTLSIQELGREISHSSIQKINKDSDVLFRFYDPAVFGSMDAFLNAWQKKRLLNNIITWYYLNGDGELCKESGAGECLDKLDFSLGLSMDVWRRMQYISLVNKILLSYRRNYEHARVPERKAFQWLIPALEYYFSHFTLGESDYIDFGIDVLMLSPDFYQNDNVKDKIMKMSARNSSYIKFRG